MLQGLFLYIIVALLIASGISSLLAMVAYRRRRTVAGAVALAYLMLATSVYSLGYAFEIANTTLAGMLFWSKFQYLGISMIPPLWVIMVMQYTGKEKWLTRPVLFALLLIPLLTIILRFTNDYHYLYYHTVSMNPNSPFPLLYFTKGHWYFVFMVYLNLSIVCGNMMLLNIWRSAAPSYRRQIATIITGSLVPWVGHIIYQAGGSPWSLDLTPFTFTCSCLICFWGMFQYQLFDLIPVARDMVFDSMHDVVLVLDTRNRIVDFNPVAQLIIKKLSKTNIGQPVTEVLEDYPDLLKQISLSCDEPISFQIAREEMIYSYHSRITPVMNKKNRLIGKTIVLSDITEQVLLLDKLKTLAMLDGLTNILNRRHFLDLCIRELCLAKKNGRSVSVIMMDLDHFKQINDTYGHEAGDITLKTATEVCRKSLRAFDLFGRYGGDEFVVFLPETSSAAACQMAERLRKNIEDISIKLDESLITVTASFGIASVEKVGNVKLDELLKKADEALYRAKEAGRNCVAKIELVTQGV